MKVQVDGGLVGVGDVVCFKSDYEQCGRVVEIKRQNFGYGYELVIENPNGFGGEYLRYATRTVERATDCWVQ